MLRPYAIFLISFVSIVATGCLTQGAVLSLEQEAQGIDRLLVCPVCPAETIDQSQVPLAKQLRSIVREKLAAGEQRQAILDFFVDRYGEQVLAAPPKSGFNLVAWSVPIAGMVLGLAALMVLLRKMRANSGERGRGMSSESEEFPDAGELSPYLSRVDQDISKLLDLKKSEINDG